MGSFFWNFMWPTEKPKDLIIRFCISVILTSFTFSFLPSPFSPPPPPSSFLFLFHYFPSASILSVLFLFFFYSSIFILFFPFVFSSFLSSVSYFSLIFSLFLLFSFSSFILCNKTTLCDWIEVSVTIVTAEGKDKLCLRIIIDEYIRACGTLHIAWNHFTKFQPTFITHGDRRFSCRRRIACLAYLSVSIIHENMWK